MSRRISLSRAARLVGVKRGTLQRQIRAGELQTFEGEIPLADLLQAYPDARVEDSSMLERVAQIIDNATFVSAEKANHRADFPALYERIMSQSKELARQKRLVELYQQFGHRLRERLLDIDSSDAEVGELADWIGATLDGIEHSGDTIDQPLANETYLRVMSAQATLHPSNHEFFVEGADSILEAGLRGGLALNYGCSNGNCGLCKMRVLSGEVRKIRPHDYQLSEAEKGLGYIIGCCNTAISDVVLEADEAQGTADIPRQQIPLRIKKIERPADDVLLLSLRTPRTRRLRFLAGQQARLSIDHVGAARYPIASCPCDDMNLQFHLDLRDDDPLATFLAQSARVNDRVELSGPEGSFVLNENSPNSLLFIAEGIGFASIKSLIEHAMALDSAADILLLWMTATGQQRYLGNLCRAWNDALDNFHYHPLDATAASDPGQAIGAILDPAEWPNYDYYLSGSTALGNAFERFAQANGIGHNQYLVEAVN